MVRGAKKRDAEKGLEKLQQESNFDENQDQVPLLSSAEISTTNLQVIGGTKEKQRQSRRRLSAESISSISDISFPSRCNEGIAADVLNNELDELQRHKIDGRFCFSALQEMCKRKEKEMENENEIFKFRCQIARLLSDAWEMLQDFGTLTWEGETVL